MYVCLCVCIGADLSDYFNYGFNEETWKAYCEKQKRLRMGLEVSAVSSVTSKITVRDQCLLVSFIIYSLISLPLDTWIYLQLLLKKILYYLCFCFQDDAISAAVWMQVAWFEFATITVNWWKRIRAVCQHKVFGGVSPFNLKMNLYGIRISSPSTETVTVVFIHIISPLFDETPHSFEPDHIIH